MIPLNVLDYHTIVLGKTGAGKSYTMRGFVERLLADKRQVCIIDPKGDWYGIKSGADGRSKGFPVLALGDFKDPNAADLPLKPEGAPVGRGVGNEIASLITQANRPVVIGFRGWMPNDRTQFWVEFAASLFNARLQRELHLVIDEVHNFAAQGKVLDPLAGKCLHWTNRLASEGRGLGIRILMASQRPQKVHKDTITCAETLCAMKVIHNLDRGAIGEWVNGCGDPERGKLVINGLAQLGVGQGWVWCPEAKFFEQVKFPKIQTFDSFSAQSGFKVADSGWATVDLAEVQERLASIIDTARQNDPEVLKRRIKELEQRQTKFTDTPEFKEMVNQRDQLTRLLASTRSQLGEAQAKLLQIQSIARYDPTEKPMPVPAVPRLYKEPSAVLAGLQPEPAADGRLGRAELAILRAAVQRSPRLSSRAQLSIISGYSVTSSSFANAMGRLRSLGLLDGGGDENRPTSQGSIAAGHVPELPTGSELVDYWCRNLGKAEATILRAIVDSGSIGITKASIAEITGYSITSSSFANALGKLRTLELVRRGEPVVAAEELQ